jgi:predicted DNA-binding protein
MPTEIKSFTLTPESIEKLEILSKKFQKSKSEIVDKLIKAEMNKTDAENLFDETVLKLLELRKTLR